jgi:hypothetical protein
MVSFPRVSGELLKSGRARFDKSRHLTRKEKEEECNNFWCIPLIKVAFRFQHNYHITHFIQMTGAQQFWVSARSRIMTIFYLIQRINTNNFEMIRKKVGICVVY